MENIHTVLDPTDRTNTALFREILAQRELFEAQIESSRGEINARLDAMDKATELLNNNMTRVPTDVDKQIQHLKELHDEKFKSVEKQFQERDVRTEQIAAASTTAISAALQAAKEAVAEQNRASALSITKSETSTTKQIDQQAAQIQSQTSSLNDKIGSETRSLNDKIQNQTDAFNDKIQGESRSLNTQINILNSRIERSEGRNSGFSISGSIISAIITSIIAIIAIIVVLAIHFIP